MGSTYDPELVRTNSTMTDKIYILQQSGLWDGPYYLSIFSNSEIAIKYLLKHGYISKDNEYEFRDDGLGEFRLFNKDTDKVVGDKEGSFYDLLEATLDNLGEI
ncbi:hypothetical protein LCGC14_0593460 [marine sediment metagenome]|uniref:Uncharacterized protein n=1 Tax=marine sediment metagenome TaxID=412755 RepID=A0A0F9ULB8_9ZZZZ